MRPLGRISFIISLPFLRWYLRRTERAYGLVVYRDELVVVKAWLARQEWQLPGGGVKRSESPEQAVVREVYEETGLDLQGVELKKVIRGQWQTDKLGHAYTIYLARLLHKMPLKVLRPELITTRWVKIKDLNNSNCPSEVLQALKAAGLL